MNLSEQVLAEYEMIIGTKFWRQYQNEIRLIRQTKSRDCETFPVEKIARVQGEIQAIDRILGLPEQMFRSLQARSKENL